jgi:hypothetical protein
VKGRFLDTTENLLVVNLWRKMRVPAYARVYTDGSDKNWFEWSAGPWETSLEVEADGKTACLHTTNMETLESHELRADLTNEEDIAKALQFLNLYLDVLHGKFPEELP